MKNKLNKTIENTKQVLNELKNSGIKISRNSMRSEFDKYLKNNAEVISEGQREQKVLNMKRFYQRKGWSFPPKKHPIASTCHLLNVYYGKEVCVHTPKDELENKIKI